MMMMCTQNLAAQKLAALSGRLVLLAHILVFAISFYFYVANVND